MPGRPFLSVVMPIHNGADWIRPTLESLRAEPTDGLEIIVIDSSSTAATANIVREFAKSLPLNLLERPDLGPWQKKTNLGVDLATADHNCILHQDDLWLPGRVRAVRSWIEAAPDAVLHLAPTLLINREGQRLGRWTCPLPHGSQHDSELLLSRLLVQNFVSVPAPIFSRTAWQRCGGMDEQLWYTPDWDIWLKLAGVGPVIYHHDITTAFRVHSNSLTVTGSRDETEFRTQMETVLDRHFQGISMEDWRRIEPTARASIEVNMSLAAASAGRFKPLGHAVASVLALGPSGIKRYLRDSRLHERLIPRLRCKLSGAF
jgi:glycosyltransferase involved in cell wall biosynthesis